MATALDAVLAVQTMLQIIVAGNTPAKPTLLTTPYTYQTNLGAQVQTGLILRDINADTYPCASVYCLRAVAGGAGAGTAEIDEQAIISIEAADKVTDVTQRLSTAAALLDDIRHAVNRNDISVHAEPLRPAPSGPVWEIDPYTLGSNLVLVRRNYLFHYVEHYPRQESD